MLDGIAHNNICFETSQHHALSRKTGSSFLQCAELQMFFDSCNVLQLLKPASIL